MIEDAFLEATRASLPELPQQKVERFQSQYGLSAYDANVLAASREQADYFEEVARIGGDAKLAANWVMVELGSLLNKLGWRSTKPRHCRAARRHAAAHP